MAIKKRFVMNKKDYRILFRNSEIDANPDYVAVSDEEARRVLADRKQGVAVLKSLLIQDQERELQAATTELQTLSMRATAPAVETDAEPDPELDREDDTLPPAYATMKAKDLDAIAVSRGIVFASGMKKSEKIDRLLQP